MINVYFVILFSFVVANLGGGLLSTPVRADIQRQSWIQVSHKHPTYPGVRPTIAGELYKKISIFYVD